MTLNLSNPPIVSTSPPPVIRHYAVMDPLGLTPSETPMRAPARGWLATGLIAGLLISALMTLGLVGQTGGFFKVVGRKAPDSVAKSGLEALKQNIRQTANAYLGLEDQAATKTATPSPAATFRLGAGININHGRQDPLQPLVQLIKPTAEEQQIKLDPLTGVSFVGVLQGSGGKGDIAMLEVVDAASQSTKTLIKPVGDFFYSNGSLVKLKRADNGLLTVTVDGQARQLPLSLGKAGLAKDTSKTSGSGLDKLEE